MSQVRDWFDKAKQIADSVEQAQAMCDLAFDAEQMANDGRSAEAVELFELLATLDQYDDLLHPAIESAEAHLALLGVRKLPTLQEIVGLLHQRFAKLPERERLKAVATALVREHGEGREALVAADELLAAADGIQPLSGKEARLRAEVEQRLRDST
jgi:hypothetical protein